MNNKLWVDRRQLVKLGLSTTVLASIPFAGFSLADEVSGEMLREVSDLDLPVESSLTGVLEPEKSAALFNLCEFVDEAWQFKSDLAAYRPQFVADLELKTKVQPSYLTEYRHAVELITLARRNHPTIDQAWIFLLFSEADVEDFEYTKLGRARRLVFSEIVSHQVPISGAFKSFGLVNYRGYFGGPYSSPASYRRTNS